MIKFFFVVRRAPGLTRKAALDHYRDVHGPMVVLPPADAGPMPAYYVQNHVIDGAYPEYNGVHTIERDLVTELHFESLAAMQAAVTTPYYLANLRPDEPRFVHDPSVARLNVSPRLILAGSRTTHKLFVLVSRAEITDEQGWSAILHQMGEAIQSWHGIAALTENQVAMPPVGERFVDCVFEAWFTDADASMAAASRAYQLFDATEVERAKSIVLVTEEITQERLQELAASNGSGGGGS